VSFLYCEIEAPADLSATVLLGTDDACKLFLNGSHVFGHRRHDPATPGRDQVPVLLRKGKNTVLLKINNGNGAHGFYFAVSSAEPLKMASGP
jgi:hypothetical protein